MTLLQPPPVEILALQEEPLIKTESTPMRCSKRGSKVCGVCVEEVNLYYLSDSMSGVLLLFNYIFLRGIIDRQAEWTLCGLVLWLYFTHWWQLHRGMCWGSKMGWNRDGIGWQYTSPAATLPLAARPYAGLCVRSRVRLDARFCSCKPFQVIC